MEDYIDILITAVQENPRFSGECVRQENKEFCAEDAFLRSLNEEQRKLFNKWESERGRTDFLCERHLLRQVFLLAREVYR